MVSFVEERGSDSPYVTMVSRGHVGAGWACICPADGQWSLQFLRREQGIEVRLEGPKAGAVPTVHAEAFEFLVVRFAVGAFLPGLPPAAYLNSTKPLPVTKNAGFRLHADSVALPDYDNVEVFVEHLARRGLLTVDPVVREALRNERVSLSDRSLRRRFRAATGLRIGNLRLIERARRAKSLIEGGLPLIDSALDAGYSDQAHMTRELRRYLGATPATISLQRTAGG